MDAAFVASSGFALIAYSRTSMSTKRTVVHLLARQPVPRAEARERGEHLVLEAAPAFELRFRGPGFDQELADHRADRRVLLGRPDACAAIDGFGK